MAIDRGKVVRCGQSANTGLEEGKQDEYLICVSALRSASHHSNEQLFKQHQPLSPILQLAEVGADLHRSRNSRLFHSLCASSSHPRASILFRPLL